MVNITREIKISPASVKTETEFFNSQRLSVKPFESNIQGLTLCLQNANGKGRRIPISDTTLPTSGDVSAFGYFWFEYISADKEYIIDVSLN